ncbi:hypothetical protein DOTSEDRAFT_171886 [Dothistroma septosporum NZE10]|uniref:Arylsulfatase n=1 Tax=Dothistroma septosporum (strain NZE10 / CBS 128990) TaxID=675120 RepID=N1PNI4_DOTSN|nr:hypothetical protein DOTSEDRAFT_171886 [Dothistroma septosporum NZE10]
MRITYAAAAIAASAALITAKKQPNIVFILTDDQDWEMQSLQHMPLLQNHIVDQGTLFDRHYCTVSICCPSRVNLWTGQAAHNNNVTDLSPPYGGYPKFVQQGLNENWLPVWLQQLGYNTYYTGKLFNHHNVQNYDDPFVNGFNGSDFLLDPYTYEYFNAHMTRNGEGPVAYTGLYSPDVVAQKAYGFLEEAVLHKDRPFFIGVAPIAPHSNMRIDVENGEFSKDTPFYAERHAHLFKEYKIPRTANFNPGVPSGVSWVKDLPQLNDTVIKYHDEFQRARLRSLQSVDEMVEEVVHRLEAHGLLDNTYIFYTTDNGYHIGQHRLPPGKECPFEEDIHIPLAVRGPGVPAGHTANVVSSHTDLTPTLLKLAGKDRPDLDGTPIPLSSENLLKPQSGEHVNVEFWGRALPEGKYGKIGNETWGNLGAIAARNNTYKALRVVSERYSFLYTVYCTGEREFYDVHRDQYQMHNLLSENFAHLAKDYTIAERPFEHILERVDALLMVTKSCKGRTCHRPWDVLHSDKNVRSLKDALDSVYDDFYKEQPRVSFSSCPLGHIVSEEGPQDVNVWTLPERPYLGGSQRPLQLPGHWSWWT